MLNAWWPYLVQPLLMVASCLLSIFVILGNLLVVSAIWHENQLHSVTNYLIASLAAADCLVGALVMPFSIISEVIMSSWTFGAVWCDLWHSFDVLASTASILNLCAISLDRYLAITDPISYPSKMTPNRVALLILSVWTCASLISFPAILWWRSVSPTPLEPIIDDKTQQQQQQQQQYPYNSQGDDNIILDNPKSSTSNNFLYSQQQQTNYSATKQQDNKQPDIEFNQLNSNNVPSSSVPPLNIATTANANENSSTYPSRIFNQLQQQQQQQQLKQKQQQSPDNSNLAQSTNLSSLREDTFFNHNTNKENSFPINAINTVALANNIRGNIDGLASGSSDIQYRCVFTNDTSYLLFSSVISFYGPLIIMLYAYYRIYRAAVKQTRFLKHGTKQVFINQHGNSGSHSYGRKSNIGNAIKGVCADQQLLVLRAHRGGGASTTASTLSTNKARSESVQNNNNNHNNNNTNNNNKRQQQHNGSPSSGLCPDLENLPLTPSSISDKSSDRQQLYHRQPDNISSQNEPHVTATCGRANVSSKINDRPFSIYYIEPCRPCQHHARHNELDHHHHHQRELSADHLNDDASNCDQDIKLRQTMAVTNTQASEGISEEGILQSCQCCEKKKPCDTDFDGKKLASAEVGKQKVNKKKKQEIGSIWSRKRHSLACVVPVVMRDKMIRKSRKDYFYDDHKLPKPINNYDETTPTPTTTTTAADLIAATTGQVERTAQNFKHSHHNIKPNVVLDNGSKENKETSEIFQSMIDDYHQDTDNVCHKPNNSHWSHPPPIVGPCGGHVLPLPTSGNHPKCDPYADTSINCSDKTTDINQQPASSSDYSHHEHKHYVQARNQSSGCVVNMCQNTRRNEDDIHSDRNKELECQQIETPIIASSAKTYKKRKRSLLSPIISSNKEVTCQHHKHQQCCYPTEVIIKQHQNKYDNNTNTNNNRSMSISDHNTLLNQNKSNNKKSSVPNLYSTMVNHIVTSANKLRRSISISGNSTSYRGDDCERKTDTSVEDVIVANKRLHVGLTTNATTTTTTTTTTTAKTKQTEQIKDVDACRNSDNVSDYIDGASSGINTKQQKTRYVTTNIQYPSYDNNSNNRGEWSILQDHKRKNDKSDCSMCRNKSSSISTTTVKASKQITPTSASIMEIQQTQKTKKRPLRLRSWVRIDPRRNKNQHHNDNDDEEKDLMLKPPSSLLPLIMMNSDTSTISSNIGSIQYGSGSHDHYDEEDHHDYYDATLQTTTNAESINSSNKSKEHSSAENSQVSARGYFTTKSAVCSVDNLSQSRTTAEAIHRPKDIARINTTLLSRQKNTDTLTDKKSTTTICKRCCCCKCTICHVSSELRQQQQQQQQHITDTRFYDEKISQRNSEAIERLGSSVGSFARTSSGDDSHSSCASVAVINDDLECKVDRAGSRILKSSLMSTSKSSSAKKEKNNIRNNKKENISESGHKQLERMTANNYKYTTQIEPTATTQPTSKNTTKEDLSNNSNNSKDGDKNNKISQSDELINKPQKTSKYHAPTIGPTTTAAKGQKNRLNNKMRKDNIVSHNSSSSLLLREGITSAVTSVIDPLVTVVNEAAVQRQHRSVGRKLSKLAKERKAAKTLGIVMGVFIVCWLPFFVANIITALCGIDCIYEPQGIMSIVTWLGWLNSAMNPVIYACWSRDFRRAFRKVLCSWVEFICPYGGSKVTKKLKLRKNNSHHSYQHGGSSSTNGGTTIGGGTSKVGTNQTFSAAVHQINRPSLSNQTNANFQQRNSINNNRNLNQVQDNRSNISRNTSDNNFNYCINQQYQPSHIQRDHYNKYHASCGGASLNIICNVSTAVNQNDTNTTNGIPTTTVTNYLDDKSDDVTNSTSTIMTPQRQDSSSVTIVQTGATNEDLEVLNPGNSNDSEYNEDVVSDKPHTAIDPLTGVTDKHENRWIDHDHVTTESEKYRSSAERQFKKVQGTCNHGCGLGIQSTCLSEATTLHNGINEINIFAPPSPSSNSLPSSRTHTKATGKRNITDPTTINGFEVSLSRPVDTDIDGDGDGIHFMKYPKMSPSNHQYSDQQHIETRQPRQQTLLPSSSTPSDIASDEVMTIQAATGASTTTADANEDYSYQKCRYIVSTSIVDEKHEAKFSSQNKVSAYDGENESLLLSVALADNIKPKCCNTNSSSINNNNNNNNGSRSDIKNNNNSNSNHHDTAINGDRNKNVMVYCDDDNGHYIDGIYALAGKVTKELPSKRHANNDSNNNIAVVKLCEHESRQHFLYHDHNNREPYNNGLDNCHLRKLEKEKVKQKNMYTLETSNNDADEPKHNYLDARHLLDNNNVIISSDSSKLNMNNVFSRHVRHGKHQNITSANKQELTIRTRQPLIRVEKASLKDENMDTQNKKGPLISPRVFRYL